MEFSKNKRQYGLTGCLIITLMLSACSSIQTNEVKIVDYEHAVPLLPVGSPDEEVPQHKSPLLDEAIQANRKTSLNEIGLAKANTIFVPSRYTKSLKGQLFINGSLYVSPNGYDNVEGFIKKGSKGLVAVVEPQSLQPLEQKSVLAYYNVSLLNGKTLNKVGILPIDYPDGITTKDAIFGIARTGRGLSFNGYASNDQRVSGPQNVIDATPLTNNGWLLLREYNPSFSMMNSDGWKKIGNHAGEKMTAAQSSVYYQSKGGNTRLLGTSPITHFIHTQRVIVNQSTLTDSVRSNMVWTEAQFKSCTDCGNVFRTAPFGLLIVGETAAIAPGMGMYIPDNANHKIQFNNTLASLHANPINIWQDRRFGNWVLSSDSSKANSQIYRAMGWKADISLEGTPGLLWGGDTRIAQVIDVPNHLIIYRNRGNSNYYKGYDDQGMGFDVASNRYIEKNDMLSWLSQYGVVMGRSLSPVY